MTIQYCPHSSGDILNNGKTHVLQGQTRAGCKLAARQTNTENCHELFRAPKLRWFTSILVLISSISPWRAPLHHINSTCSQLGIISQNFIIGNTFEITKAHALVLKIRKLRLKKVKKIVWVHTGQSRLSQRQHCGPELRWAKQRMRRSFLWC